MLEKYVDFSLQEVYVDHERCIGGNCPLNKIASEGSGLIDTVEQKKDHAYFHVIAMGSGDYYNENNNGDFFYEKDLKDYCETFSNAGIFIQHDNKNPEKTLGKVAKVLYNDDMHRVELILEVSKEKSPSIYDRAKSGERLAVSMGVKVPKESCAYCGHITQGSIANRCDHLKYQMHQQMENGQVVYAINHPPMNFFDISFVRKPADTQGHALFTKVAGDIEDVTEDDHTAQEKIAELVKYIDAASNMPRPAKADLDTLKDFGPHGMPKLMAGNGIFILPSEALYLADLIDFDHISECSPSVDNKDFLEQLFEKFSENCSCSLRQGSASLDKPGLRHLAARTSLIKEASYTHKKGDVFGNKFRGMDAVRSKKDLASGGAMSLNPLASHARGIKKFPQVKVNFHDGESITINSHAARKYGIPEYYIDLVSQGYAENIMGIMANGNEKVIYRG